MDGIFHTSTAVYYRVGRRVFSAAPDEIREAHASLDRRFARGRHPYSRITKRCARSEMSSAVRAKEDWMAAHPEVLDWCDWCDEADEVLSSGGRLSEVGYILPEDAERVAEIVLN